MSEAADPAELIARSRSYKAAALRSEERRAYAVILVVAFLTLMIAGFSTAEVVPDGIKIVGAVAGLALLLMQVAMIVLARRCGCENAIFPPSFAAAAVTLECSVPALVIGAHIGLGTVSPYVALGGPPLLAYGVLIGLTTLRLRPWLCLWAGFVASLGFAALVVYVRFVRGIPFPADGWPAAGYVMAALTILSTGVAAAWVTREIRRHLEAALSEAEIKRRMERVEQDLDLARTIQRSLLPPTPPRIVGFDTAAWNQPADQTGGDYYDWLEQPGGDWLITLADVAGHGIGPALITAECRAYVRALAERGLSLPQLLVGVNALLAADLPPGRFITLVAARIRPDRQEMSLLSAGHGPILHFVRRTGEVRVIPAAALPLAVVPDLDPGRETEIDSGPGDVLALVTDGFAEWARPRDDGRREEFGLQRLSGALAAHAHKPAAEIIEGVLAEATEFAGDVRQQDDLTMVIIKRVTGE